jgi:hypothetical protein
MHPAVAAIQLDAINGLGETVWHCSIGVEGTQFFLPSQISFLLEREFFEPLLGNQFLKWYLGAIVVAQDP